MPENYKRAVKTIQELTSECERLKKQVIKLQNTSHDYAYKTVEEYEKIVEHKVNDSFKIGWDMARTTNAMLGITVEPETNNADLHIFTNELESYGLLPGNLISLAQNSLQAEVGQWADKTFPHSNDKSKIEHIRDEIDELNAAPSDPFEAADIFLIMLHLAYSKNYDLYDKALQLENLDDVGSTVLEAIQYIQKQFKELQANPDNVELTLKMTSGLLKVAEVMGYDLFQVSKEKFALVQKRVYGEPDDRGVCHHTVKANGE